MGNLGGCFLVSFPEKSIPCSSNITTIDGNKVIVITEGKYTIEHYEISYAGLNDVVYVCFY